MTPILYVHPCPVCAKRPKLLIKSLGWSRESEPNTECRYTHVFVDTTIGRFTVTWKSWKTSPLYGVDLAGEYLHTLNTLEECKLYVNSYIHATVSGLVVDAPESPYPGTPPPLAAQRFVGVVKLDYPTQ